MGMQEPTILYEDEAVVVVNKPSGMIVYPDGRHDYPALSAWLEKKYNVPVQLEETSTEGDGGVSTGGGSARDGFHFVHRIDRETSGVLVVAKSAAAHAFLKEQFKERDVRKVYRAFVYGVIKDDRGIIDKPIGNARGGRGPRSALRPHGELREALTTFKVLERSFDADPTSPSDRSKQDRGVSYVEVRPKTGRTHQIRVHFAAIQRPILCDQLYAPGRPSYLGFERLALHAYSLTITLPSTGSGQVGEEKTFTAPLPPDFVAAEAALRGKI